MFEVFPHLAKEESNNTKYQLLCKEQEVMKQLLGCIDKKLQHQC